MLPRNRPKRSASPAASVSSLRNTSKRRIRKQRRAEISEREIRRQLIGPWHDKAVTEITRDDVRELIENLTDRGTPYEAHGAFGHARTFFNWLIETGKFKV